MAEKKTFFNDEWTDEQLHPEFAAWIARVPENAECAYCNVCRKTFKLSNMGHQAITSHADGLRHKKNVKAKAMQPSLLSFSNAVQLKPNEINKNVQENDKKVTQNISSFFQNEDVLKAEIIWAMELVSKKMSINSCKNIGQTFKMMFPSCPIVSKFTLGKTKASYVINHGLAPYFREHLRNKVNNVENYVICFDESLNKISQKGQMDLVIRFWDDNLKKVSTRYLNSAFLGRARAKDLLEKFIEGLDLPLNNLLQVSMDGPNVNLCFYEMLMKEMHKEDPDGKKLIDTGVCGLHVLHGALKHGLKISQWNVHQTLRDMYYLFHCSPARRAEYVAVTNSTQFPQKFCSIRWLENSPCIERAVHIFDNVKQFVEESSLPICRQQSSLKEQMKDPLLKCKLIAFKMLSLECETFLRRFQSNKPLIPFLHTELIQLLHNLLKRCVKEKILDEANTSKDLLSLELSNENLLNASEIDIGFEAKKELKRVKCSEKNKNEFRLQFRQLIVALVDKLRVRSPLKYRFVRAVTCFAPNIILKQATLGKKRADIVLEVLHESNRISGDLAEKAKKQYSLLCIDAQGTLKETFEEFVARQNDTVGLDEFYSNILDNDRFSSLFKISQICLIMSHGNSSVEGGFSVNKSLLVENLLEQSLIAQRTIHDAITAVGGVANVLMTRELLQFVKGSRKRYQEYLDRESNLKSEENNKKKEKRKIEEELKELEEKKKRLKIESHLQESAMQKKK